MTESTCNNLQNWTSAPEQSLTVNINLLAAAQSLLSNIYTYAGSSDAPDYCPTLYTQPDYKRTGYVVHSTHQTQVCWPQAQQNQIVWKSEPGSAPKGWSGTVVVAGNSAIPSGNAALPVQCFTDCSGFITSLFTYVNQHVKTAFIGWKSGADNTIPEAGYFVKNNDAKDSYPPNDSNYYRFFTQPGFGFQGVSLADVQPGDLLAWANAQQPPKDSGHIMLVAAIADDPSDSTGKTKQVIVIDESSGHTLDTRANGAGIGLGIVKLTTNNSSNELQFYWTCDSKEPQPGLVALGRASTAS